MLREILNYCLFGADCATTIEEDEARIRRKGTDITTYPSIHPLYPYYKTYIANNKDLFVSICRNEISSNYIVSTQDDMPLLTIARAVEDNIVYKGFAQSALYYDYIEKCGMLGCGRTQKLVLKLKIHTICTTPDSKLGRKLIESIISYIKSYRLKVHSIVVESTSSAIDFYEKTGFEIQSLVDENDLDSLTVMEKKIGGRRTCKKKRSRKLK